MDIHTTALLVIALGFGFYMAWNIGANDVSNAMGTSVGSGALTLKAAVIIAAIMEFSGAFFVGSHVTETMRSGIVDLTAFREHENGASMLAYGMLASLLAAGVWLNLASYFGWPVSTTHSLVGAIAGFGLVSMGSDAINWIGPSGIWGTFKGEASMVGIVLSWVISPALAAIISYALFRLVLNTIFYRPDPLAAAKKITPIMSFCVLITMTMMLHFKGMKPFWKEHFGLAPTDAKALTIGLSVSLLIAAVGTFFSWYLARRLKTDEVQHQQLKDLYAARSLSKAIMHLRRVRDTSDEEARAQAVATLQSAQTLLHEVNSRTKKVSEHNVFRDVERIFIYLQIVSASFVAFAHGANDVSNAIGPLSIIIDTVRHNAIPETSAVPTWVLGLGAVGIVVGLATWGWRVIQTVGKRITELTPSRGFCAEFAAALTILIASVNKLPVSTTHTLVGAVLGVGLARGIGALNLNMVRDIAASWVVTIPAGAGLSILFYYTLLAIFG
jgi:PiT family inorganic phosphate transporter